MPAPSPPVHLQVYAFSAENWARPAAEVDALLALMERTLAAEVAELAAQGVRLRFIGELGMLPQSLQRQMRRWVGGLVGPGWHESVGWVWQACGGCDGQA